MGNVDAKGRVPVSHWETSDGTLLTCDLMTRASGYTGRSELSGKALARAYAVLTPQSSQPILTKHI